MCGRAQLGRPEGAGRFKPLMSVAIRERARDRSYKAEVAGGAREETAVQ